MALKLIGDENCWIGKSRIGVFSPDPEHRPAHIRPLIRLNETYPLSLWPPPPPMVSPSKKLAPFCATLCHCTIRYRVQKKKGKSIPFHCLKWYRGVDE